MGTELTVEDIQKHLGDREWRLNHLYYIKDENGNKVLFKPNKVQKMLHDAMWFFNIVPKARQLGITTYFCILYFDQVLFSQNKTAGIIAHRQEDMKKIFRNKIRFAWDNLHPWLKEYIGSPNTDSAYELVFPNGSTIFVSMTTRSGTVQFLHISEFGYICQKFPEKAEEIVTGAINSVHPGNMVSIESTAAGQEGYFYDFCMKADRTQKERRELTQLDFKLFFFPWWIDERYTMEGKFPITQEFEEYFKLLKDKYNIKLTEGQKRWYMKKKELNGEKMFSEYPSTLEEAFRVSVEGAYYSKEMQKVYRENRIRPIPHDPMFDVDTWWDLGMNDFNVVLLTQTKGNVINFINMYWNSGEGLKHYYDWLKDEKDKYNYRYNAHYFPHDVEVRELGTGVSRKQTLYKLGMTNIRTGPPAREVSIEDGRDEVRKLFPRFNFDELKCEKLHQALFNYRKEFDKKLGVFKDKHKHDENSHFADAVRLLAMMWREQTIASEIEQGDQDQSFFG